MTPEEFFVEYQRRLGRWMLNPFDYGAMVQWFGWLPFYPGPVRSWSPGGAA